MTSGTTSGKAPQRVAARKTGGRREEIASIASGLFARHGFEGTSIRDIAAAAGLTKPALYYHFADKEALYEYVLAERMAKLIANVRAEMDAAPDPVGRIVAYISSHTARMDRDRDGWLVSRQSFLSISDAERRKRITALRDEFEHLLRDEVAGAMEAGQLDRTDPAMVARLLLSSVNDLPRWLRPGGSLKAQDVGMLYLTITLRGLGADLPLPEARAG